jgi:predicted MFS family arabinose efflux permease
VAGSGDQYRQALNVLRLGNFASVYDRYSMPAMLLAIGRTFDASAAQVSIAVSVYFLSYALMQPAWGILAGRLGPVRVMRFCATTGVIATLLAVLSPSMTTLVVSRAVGGGVLGALVPASLIYAGDALPDASRQRGLTSLMTANAIGTTTATATSGLVVTLMGWRWALAVSLMFVLAAALSLRTLPSHPPPAGQVESPLVALGTTLRSGFALLLLVLVFLEGAAVQGCLTFLPTALESGGLGTAVSSATIAFFGLAVVATAVVVGRLSERTPMWVFIAVGATAGACGAAAIGLVGSLPMGIAAAALLGVTWGMSHSSLQTWATQVLPPERSTVIALFASCLFGGSAASAVVGGMLLSRGLLSLQFFSCAGLLVAVAVVGSGGRRRWERGISPC